LITRTQNNLLDRLAALYRIETSYTDYRGQCRHAGPQSLQAVLRALGAPVEKTPDVPDALRARIQELWQSVCEPVTVTWDGAPACLELRLPAAQTGKMVACRLLLEDGRSIRWHRRISRLPVLRHAQIEGATYESRQITLPAGLPLGYHRLGLDLPSVTKEVFIIAAPRRAFAPPVTATGRLWGVFCPLYALRTRHTLGTGDLGELEILLQKMHGLGGKLVGTLPLLAAFLDEPFAPGPYEPVSRRFWNEFYLELARVPELKQSPEAAALFNSPAFLEESAALRAAPLVDYRRGMALKRRLLEVCARHCFAENNGRRDALLHWAAQNPAVRDYARFRAAVERRRAPWPEWPRRMRDGHLREGDYAPEAERYHLYVQWLAHEQLRQLWARAHRRGQKLYLDLPLGVHGGGYDTWRERTAFALEAGSGAPPDAFFTGGQNWGFPPLHPERIREQGYRYFAACLRHHLRHARILRLDHAAALHRLFWIPEGMGSGEGIYVRYHASEFYAVLALESQRHQALIVGEDLGMVPACVRRAMSRHRIHRMYVLPFEVPENHPRLPRPAPEEALACLNTHDLPPFAAYWQSTAGTKIQVDLPVFLHRQGRLPAPTNQTEAVFRACLEHLAAGRSRILLINLEDLWLETAAQNLPGTTVEHPNWRRKARHTLEELTRLPGVPELLQEINRLRNMRQDGSSSGSGFTPPCPLLENKELIT